MIEIRYTEHMKKWFNSIKDAKIRSRIKVRIRRMSEGNFGDFKSVGSGILEMRIHCGSGYRIYFINRNNEIVILLCGGDKDTQQNDIQFAKNLAKKEVQYEA